MRKVACFTGNQSAKEDPLTFKMAPWPEQGIGPKAPDKTPTKTTENKDTEETNESSNLGQDHEDSASVAKVDEKVNEEKNPDVSNLNDDQLKALLNEALTYKCPKDREGKSDLFIELLTKAESDKPECVGVDGRRGNQGCSFDPSPSSRYYNSRRRGRKDAPTTALEQTRGGSLQNLVHAFSSEFDSSFSYYTSHSSARSRKLKRGSKEYGVSVSARQREGGSLPSNVNVGGSGMLAFPGQEYSRNSTAATVALLFEDGASIETQKSPSVHSSGSDAKVVKAKEAQQSLVLSDLKDLKPVMSKEHTNCNETKPRKSKEGAHTKATDKDMQSESVAPEFVAINIDGDKILSQVEASRKLNDDNKVQFGENGDSLVCDEGTEMEVLKKRDVYTTCATFEVGLGDGKKARFKDQEQEQDVDDTVKFPLSQQIEKTNGEQPLQLPSSYNSVNCFLGQSERNGSYQTLSTAGAMLSNSLRVDGTKTLITNIFPMSSHVSVLTIPQIASSWIPSDTVSRLPLNRKEVGGDGKGKSYDENGNAVTQGHRDFNNGNERKSKTRRAKTNNDKNVVMSQNIEGHRGDKDIDYLLEFIESDKERKGKMNKNNSNRSNNVVGSEKGTKSRDRKLLHQNTKGENNKLKKTNSLEEISKTKLEDLTSEKTGVLRKPKKQSTMDDADLSRVGDRRPWSNQENQEYYFNDPASADENCPSNRKKRRGEVKEDNNVPAPTLSAEETDFRVVTKKQRRKKRPSSSSSKGGLFDETRKNQCNQQQRDNQRRGNTGFPPHDRDVLYQYHRPMPPDLRRKSASSMPPSDKSDSSDLDSVHSLPVSSTTPKLTLDQTSTSSGSTPQASYADIARISSANPPNINVSTTKWPAITSSSNQHPNPQSITSSKVNIGVPPISGKVTANPVPSVSSSSRSEDGDEPENIAAHYDLVLSNLKPMDPRPKIYAVINTPVDVKVIPPSQTSDKSFVKQVVENSSNKVTLGNIQIEITDRTVSPAIITNDGVVKRKCVDVASKRETDAKTSKSLGDNKSDVDSASAAPPDLPVVAIRDNAVVAGLPTGEHQVLLTSEGAGVPVSKVAKSDLYDKSITKTGKVNTGSKKSTANLSRTTRPAVIILDDKESVSVSQNISASDITFGFEVNELLLLSDGGEGVESSGFNSVNTSDNQSVVERTVVSGPYVDANANKCEPISPCTLEHNNACENQDIHTIKTPNPSSYSQYACGSLPTVENQENNSLDIPREYKNTPNQTTKVDEFFARFKSPMTQLTESHTKIVNIIGLAWADVMKELEAGGNVQYYNGQ